MDRAKRAGEYKDREAEAAIRGRDEQDAEIILNLAACLFPLYVVRNFAEARLRISYTRPRSAHFCLV